jgi:hypothetical protein
MRNYTGWYDVADREGFPISGIMPHMGWLGGNLDSPAKTAGYRAQTERVMRRYRNHPSIVMWGSSGNMMGGSLDPRYVGVHKDAKRVDISRSTNLAKAIPLAEKGLDVIKSLDATRPVFIHNGGPTGDIYTVNNYLNFIPLQEREEWLSNYAQKGDMPLMYVEFGTPVSLSLMRARNGFPSAPVSEMFLSEYMASYLGDEAYRMEPAAYRKRTADIFRKTRRTLALGHARARFRAGVAQVSGTVHPQYVAQLAHHGHDRRHDRVGQRLLASRRPAHHCRRCVCAPATAPLWRGSQARSDGDVAAFTAKDHSFSAGETVRKQVALLNDARRRKSTRCAGRLR